MPFKDPFDRIAVYEYSSRVTKRRLIIKFAYVVDSDKIYQSLNYSTRFKINTNQPDMSRQFDRLKEILTKISVDFNSRSIDFFIRYTRAWQINCLLKNIGCYLRDSATGFLNILTLVFCSHGRWTFSMEYLTCAYLFVKFNKFVLRIKFVGYGMYSAKDTTKFRLTIVWSICKQLLIVFILTWCSR